MVRSDLRNASRIRNRDEDGQILILRAERVADPRAHAGKTIENKSGAHLVLGGAVRVRLCRHRMNETKIVGQFRELRKHIGNHFSGLAARTKGPMWFREIAIFSLEGDELVCPWHRLAIALEQFRFVIPRFQVRASSGAEDDEDILCSRLEMRPPRRMRMLGGPFRANGRF